MNYKCQDVYFDLPPHKYTEDDLSLKSSIDSFKKEEYSYQWICMINMCFLREKYDNFIMLINPDVDLSDSPEELTMFNGFLKLKYTTDKLIFDSHIYLNIKDPKLPGLDYFNTTKDIMVAELKKLYSRKERFIIINLKLPQHANIIIYDTKIHYVYHFEPHGANSHYIINGFHRNEIESFFKEVDEEVVMMWADMYLPWDGFQNMDGLDSILLDKKKDTDSNGYCFYWCMFFLSNILKKPNISIITLSSIMYWFIQKSKSKRINFRRLIRNYSENMEKKARKQYSDLFYLDDNESNVYKLKTIKTIKLYIETFDYPISKK